ncbi:hypothetical protein CSHISOI_11426 [Colletotrichum shisoi]|uniref:Uncharacterized protein n=1 Tax=Colletotrichum shisoi TaxID=2078593 RepID=A0A5Q4BB94_9PEZI|nr:hypothetical protein CSHISOI_11426 [Colletotrichum shisoi]
MYVRDNFTSGQPGLLGANRAWPKDILDEVITLIERPRAERVADLHPKLAALSGAATHLAVDDSEAM